MTSNTFKQAAYSQETDEVFICLIELSSDELEEPIRISSDPYEAYDHLGEDIYGCTSNGEEYIFLPFDIILPRDDSTGAVFAKLIIENIDRTIIPQARSVRKPIDVSVKCVLSSDVDFVELEYNNFKLSNVSYDGETIEGDLSSDYWDLEPAPSGSFTPSKWPGLF